MNLLRRMMNLLMNSWRTSNSFAEFVNISLNCIQFICLLCGLRSSWLEFHSGMRARNTAEPLQLVKVFRSELPHGFDERKFMVADVEVVVGQHFEMMISILRLTPRPTEKLLSTSMQQAFPKESPAEVKACSDRLGAAFAHCRLKMKQSTSGVKLPAGVKEVVAFMKGQGCPSGDAATSPETVEPPRSSLALTLRRRALKRLGQMPVTLQCQRRWSPQPAQQPLAMPPEQIFWLSMVALLM